MIIGFDKTRKCPVVLPQKPSETMMIAYAVRKHGVDRLNLEVLQTVMEWFILYHTDRTTYEKEVAVFKPGATKKKE